MAKISDLNIKNGDLTIFTVTNKHGKRLMIYKHMNMQGFHGKFFAYIGKGSCEINLWAHSWLKGDFGNLAIKRWGRKPIIAGIVYGMYHGT